MVAAVRAITGTSPEAYVGDSAVPETVKTRTLQEETHRVFRARVVTRGWLVIVGVTLLLATGIALLAAVVSR